MDIVIALGTGSRWMDNELRYALRSIEAYLGGFDGKVVLVGEKPKWVRNVHHIAFDDVPGRKNLSIFQKIVTGSEWIDSDDFIFWNDDHFLLKPLHTKDFKFWYDQDCHYYAHKATGLYKQAITNTNNLPGKNNYYTDIHTPIIYNKHRFAKLMHLPWKQEFVIKSAYTKNEDGPFERMEDIKINRFYSLNEWIGKTYNKLFFSIGSYAVNNDFKVFINQLYPNKSQWEK
jgi:hypothetical protein